MARSAFALILLLPASLVGATIIDNSTFGFYNSGLGDLALDSILGAQTDTASGFHLFPAANVSAGDPLIPPVASEPNLAGADAGTQAALGSFLGNTAALGGTWSAIPQAIPANWTVNSETAIVYQIDAGAGLSNLHIDVGVDNGIFLWLDGVYLFGALAPGGASIGEYGIDIPSLSSGPHYLQVLREDHGGATGYVIEVSADDQPQPAVPEPGSWTLLALGCVCVLIGSRRRMKQPR